ncbi:MAG: AzlC family ABC transporter permease [Christensenellaceae bacterium]|nr:AzlC family ABC transporter permease [Christensenellaceae bacterium]
MKDSKKTIREAFLDTVPVMAGYIVLGIGFGVIMEAKGYGLIWSAAMGLFIYAGSMQYVAVDLLSAGASVLTAALTTLMVNARHLFYGISMVEKYKTMGKIKPYLIFALTDETYSLVVGKEFGDDLDPKTYYTFVSLFDHLYWVTGCVLGSVIGSLIGFSTEGIDFALTALFITVMTEQWLSAKNHFPAIAGVLSTLLCLVIFGSDSFLIPSMILITLVLTIGKKYTAEADHE